MARKRQDKGLIIHRDNELFMYERTLDRNPVDLSFPQEPLAICLQ